MDRRAWWATVHGVTQSQTQLTWLSTHTHELARDRNTGKYTWKRYSEMALGAWRHLLQSVTYYLINVWKQVIFLQLSMTSPRKSMQKALSRPCECKDNQTNTDSGGRTRDRKLMWISWVLPITYKQKSRTQFKGMNSWRLKQMKSEAITLHDPWRQTLRNALRTKSVDTFRVETAARSGVLSGVS